MIKQLAVALALSTAPAVIAQTYIVPDGDCGAIKLHATRGSDFPNLGETIDADRVTNAYVYLPKKRVAVKPAEGVRSFEINADVVPDNGVVMAAFSFTPVVSSNETRTEHAKAFIRCGEIARRDDWQRSTGLGLEIFPQWNGRMPLKPGETMRFIAVDNAKKALLRDVKMELYRAGAGHAGTGSPDEHGGMNFPYKEPGRYMVTATYRRPDPQKPEHWIVDTSTLTFEMK